MAQTKCAALNLGLVAHKMLPSVDFLHGDDLK